MNFSQKIAFFYDKNEPMTSDRLSVLMIRFVDVVLPFGIKVYF